MNDALQKIIDENRKPLTFGDMTQGDVFENDGAMFIKTRNIDEPSDDPINAINISEYNDNLAGECWIFTDDEPVKKFGRWTYGVGHHIE